MTYVRKDGQVLEFTGRQARKNYDQAKVPEPEVKEASRSVVIAGRILQPITSYIRRRFKIKGVTLTCNMHEDGGYAFMSTVQCMDGTMKVSMFSQAPPNKFSVWRG